MATTPNRAIQNVIKKIKKGIEKDVARKAAQRAGRVAVRLIQLKTAKGISPIRNDGRYGGYSDSYKAQIKGEVDFRTINGKVVPIDFTAKEKKISSQRKLARRILASQRKRRPRSILKRIKSAAKEYGKKFFSKKKPRRRPSVSDLAAAKTRREVSRFRTLSVAQKKIFRANRVKFKGKRVRPVNLRLSGQLMRSLKAKFDAGKKELSIGFYKDRSVELEEYLRDGKVSRKIIPRTGEELTIDIQRKLSKVYEKEVIKVISNLK